VRGDDLIPLIFGSSESGFIVSDYDHMTRSCSAVQVIRCEMAAIPSASTHVSELGDLRREVSGPLQRSRKSGDTITTFLNPWVILYSLLISHPVLMVVGVGRITRYSHRLSG
jgi:hypothetical protein